MSGWGPVKDRDRIGVAIYNYLVRHCFMNNYLDYLALPVKKKFAKKIDFKQNFEFLSPSYHQGTNMIPQKCLPI